MIDLVSRQYLLDEYDRQHQGPPGGARKIIEEAPAVQEIIRCRECAHFHPTFCAVWSRFGTVQPPADGYCYKAERRDT